MKGFALVEVMVSLVLGLLIISGVYEVYLAAERHYHYLQGMVYLQENGQMVAYAVQQTLPLAGYAGCRKIDDLLSVKNHVAAAKNITMATIIQGYDAQSIAQVSKDIAKRIVADTDAVLVHYLSSEHATLLQSSMTSSYKLSVTLAPQFKTGSQLMIADCEKAELITATEIKNSADIQWLTLNEPVSEYQPGSAVGEWITMVFYIGKTGRFNNAGNAITALYIQTNGREEEVVEGVDALKIQYGINTGQGVVHFESAASISDWTQVKALKMQFMLDSLEPVLSQPQELQFPQKTWLAPDRRLYKTWNMLIGLPNR